MVPKLIGAASTLVLAIPFVLLLHRAAPAEDRSVEDLAAEIDQFAREPFEQRRRQQAIRVLGQIGGKKAVEVLLPLFEDPFEHLPDHVVSAWIRMLKGDRAAETLSTLVARGLGSRDPRVRIGAATAIGIAGGENGAAAIGTAFKREKHAEVVAALAEAAAGMRGEPDLAGIFIERLDEKDGNAVFHTALAAARFDPTDSIAPLVESLSHRDPLARAGAVLALQSLDALPETAIEAVLTDSGVEPRMALAESLCLRTSALPWPGKGEEALAMLLAADSWRVRSAAIQGALLLWDNRIVDDLIERLGKEESRLADDVRSALATYTGRDLGSDPELWTEWWKGREQSFKAGARPRPLPCGRIARGAHARGDEEDQSVAFFDIPVVSDRIAFVFDLSGSMREPVEGDSDSDTKLELLIAEFRRTLSALPPETTFDLFVYRYPSDYPPKAKLLRAFGRLTPARPAAVKKATAWLAKQEARGWGAFYEPLTTAFAEDVDSVILLSDGRPSRGTFDRDFRLLKELPKANRFRHVAVNTVLIGGKGADREFMERLAASTGGRFSRSGGR